MLASLEVMRPGERFTAAERMLGADCVHSRRGCSSVPSSLRVGRPTARSTLCRGARAGRPGADCRHRGSSERRADRPTCRRGHETQPPASFGESRTGKRTPLAAVGVAGDLARLARAAEAELVGQTLVTRRNRQGTVALVRLGEPALGGLRLVFSGELAWDRRARAAGGFRRACGSRNRPANERRCSRRSSNGVRALLAVVGQAIAELSLPTRSTPRSTGWASCSAHSARLSTSRNGRAARNGRRARAGRPHLRVADALLGLALGISGRGRCWRSRKPPTIPLSPASGRRSRRRASTPSSRFQLRAAGELIGLLVAYLPSGRRLHANESALLAALAGQLAVVVQNAGLHEETMRLASDREEALGPSDGRRAGLRRSSRSRVRSRRAWNSSRPSTPSPGRP